MPRSAITGAKQHHAFQQRGFSRILDLKGVTPLFNVETCVLIREFDEVYTVAIPTIQFEGILPAHECTWVEASPLLIRRETTTDFTKQELIASEFYHSLFKQGATLVPRNLAFVASAQPDLAPGQLANSPIMRTDPDANDEAKAPWKGLSHTGYIDEEFLYTTLLSKHLVPFGVGRLHLVALSVRIGVSKQFIAISERGQEQRFIPVSLEEMRESYQFARSAEEWFAPVEQLWQQYKKETTKETLAQWFNYQNKLTAQSPTPGYFVLYGATGSNLAATVVDTHSLPLINGARSKAFVVDHKTYWYRAETNDEAHFLVALLNAPCVDAAIKQHQTRGLFGARDIHRRPFEVCAIPRFNPLTPSHQQLVSLSQMAHALVAELDLSQERVVAARKHARQATQSFIEQIDGIAQNLLGLSPPKTVTENEKAEVSEI